MVPLNRRDRFAVSKAVLEFGRIKDVGKKQGQQTSAMFALKFFNFSAVLYRDLLQFPNGHEHQSTKVGRRNQWEKWSNGRDALQLFRSGQTR